MLAGRVFRATALLIGARFFGRLIDLAALLILARLLTPNDFGVVAAAMTLISITEAALELPVGLVLVRTHEPGPDHYDTAFTLSVLRGLLLGLVVAGIAWPFAWTFDDPRLVPVILCLAWAPMIRGCTSPGLAVFTRELNLRPDCCAQIVGKIAALAAALAVVAVERNYWALVAATVVGPTAMVAASYALAPYRPRLSLGQWRLFWDFLSWLGGAQVLSAISWQCDRLILGQLTSRPELGRYTMADTLSALPVQALAAPAASILFPAFGSIHTDRDRLHRGFLLGVAALYTLCLPVMVGLLLLAGPICRTVLGPQWDETVPPLQVLSAAVALSLVALPLGSLLHALGQTKVSLMRCLVGLAIKLPLMIAGGLAHGLIGVACARLATEVLMFAVTLRNIRQATGLPAARVLAALARPAVAAGAMALTLLALAPLLTISDSQMIRILALAGTVLVGALVYALALLALWAAAGRPEGIEAKAVAFARDWGKTLRRGRTVLLPAEPAVVADGSAGRS